MTKDTKKEIGQFLTLLRALQKIDAEFPLQYAICFAEISLDEGLSLTQLSDRTNMAISTVSRIIGALSDSRQKGQPFGLIEVQISKEERRRKELYLSPKGRQLINSIASLMV